MRHAPLLVVCFLLSSAVRADEAAWISFHPQDGSVVVKAGSRPIAEYIWNDEKVRRPYFRHLRTLAGIQVTRNYPPVEKQDVSDHPTMHPGVWLSFGDLSGADFWRNKGRVRQLQLVRPVPGDTKIAAFTVRNSYEFNDKTICIEDCRLAFESPPAGYLLTWDSVFRSEANDFMFGDQEEMGLGVRMATPLSVIQGGAITDSEGRKNGKEVWGKQADWCDYQGVIEGQNAGIVLMPQAGNFRRSWFHARDYGLLVANPFGQNAFTKGEKSKITVAKGASFRLRFGVYVYQIAPTQPTPIADVYREYAKRD